MTKEDIIAEFEKDTGEKAYHFKYGTSGAITSPRSDIYVTTKIPSNKFVNWLLNKLIKERQTKH